MSDEGSQSKAPPGGDEKSTGGAKKPRAKRRTTKSRSSKPAAKNPAAKKPEDTPAEAETERADPQEDRKLPAYGLAADVLAGRPPQDEPVSTEETGAFDFQISDPERIFSFADRLASEADVESTPEAPKVITTWVTFSLSGEVFALPVEPVREVLRVASITRVPHAPAPIRGVSNVRGRVIPVIDLRLRIGLEATDLDRASRVIVVRSRGRRLGLLVDAVHQVVHLDLNRAQSPPDDVMTLQSDYISGVYHLDEQLVLLLDVERALLIRDSGGEDLPARDGHGPDSDSHAGDARTGSPGAA